jgi:alkylresorcinol/alkylpyrone synthase
VGTIIAATSTGNLVPSLASRLVERLGLAAEVLCVPLTGLGCGGGLRALTLASRLVAHDRKPALVVCIELPSLWLQLAEPSTEDIYGYLTFGDGAAAAVIGDTDGSGPEVVAGGQVQWPDSMAARGACLTGSGWRHVSTPALPRVLATHLRSSVTASLAAQGLRWGDVDFCMVNPLDPRLLDTAQRLLGVTERETAASRQVWREHGNMLSAGIFFSLGVHVETTRPSEGDVGLLVALGPGITCDATMLRWQGELNVR